MDIKLDVAKKLKEVGFPQNTQFYWVNVFENLEGNEELWQIQHIGWISREKEIYHHISAPLVEELMSKFKGYVSIEKKENGYHASDGDNGFADDNPCNALGDLYIWVNTLEK